MAIDFKAIRAKAESYADDMTKFMCDLIAIPGESCQKGPTVQRIKQEMEKVGFDKVEIDPMGNIFVARPRMKGALPKSVMDISTVAPRKDNMNTF